MPLKQEIERIDGFFEELNKSKTHDEAERHDRNLKTAALALYEHIGTKKKVVMMLLDEIQSRLQLVYSAHNVEEIKAHLPVAKRFTEELDEELRHL